MKTLFNQLEYHNSKSEELLPCECYHCQKTFYAKKSAIKRAGKQQGRVKFCSKFCKTENSKIMDIDTICTNCNKSIKIKARFFKKTKTGRFFCNKSCSAQYNNTHKEQGTKISKLEKWLQEELQAHYPSLHFQFNDKLEINSELDIYIPSIKLAFELNGIFHYEPIYGSEKLNQIQNNDCRKFQACLDKRIELCIIDTSQQKYFNKNTSKKYLDIITTIINQKVPRVGFEPT